MEKEEAVSLRDALENMDVQKQEDEEARIHAAAQNEASELVYQHQNPEDLPQPDAPYRYRDHLRKNSYQHARSASVGRYNGSGIATGLARDSGHRTVSGGSSTSGDIHSQRGRISMDSFEAPQPIRTQSLDQESGSRTSGKSYGSISSSSRPPGTRRKSSTKRNISGEVPNSFTGEQIWEEPEQETDRGRAQEIESDFPEPLRTKPRNPLNRVQFVQESGNRSSSTPPETTKKLSRFEIYRNPPSQSRNPNYTANPPPAAKEVVREVEVEGAKEDSQVPMKDGLEIRSDEIRQATSMFLKDRSPKLPTPTVVSDRPGRPIVSFDNNWKPKGADEKPEVRRRSPFDRYSTNNQSESLPSRQATSDVTPSIPTINIPDPPTIQVDSIPTTQIPTINFPDSTQPVPTINFPDSTPNLPIINVSNTPTISVSAPGATKDTRRPLPDPKTAASRTTQRQAPVSAPRGHWSAAGKRATATCHQCQLPIEGRVVKLSGSPENFHPQCFICFSCGTGLESLEIRPEPSVSRSERLDRIKRRARGEEVPEVDGQTYADDGDERLRFFCHLDWHERYAPRCKHCTTPIMEEHMIALGEHWHYGHFFCAECGDPFEKGVSHIEKDGYAWCIKCQTKRTERRAPKCKKCRQPVVGEYVQALGGEWHDKCFRCATCQGGFDDGSFFPKVVGNETIVLCTGCIQRELKA